MKGFIGGIPVALLAVAAQAKFAENQAGGTAIGGASGIDGDGGFISPNSATIKPNAQVNEWSEDDHSVKLQHTDVYPRPAGVPVPFGHPGFPGGPQVPGMGPFGKRDGPAGTVFGHHHHSDHDEDKGFHMSVNDASNTEVNEYSKDDHSVDVKHEDVYPHAPAFTHFRRSENHGPPAHGGAPHGGHFESHPEPHYAPHTESHYEPHPEPHYVNHPEPHVENHPEPHYAPHYSPTYAPHYEPHTTVEHDLTSVKDNNNGPTAGKISFSRRGFPGAPGPHFEDHPEPHYEPHSESHYEPHPEPHYVNHPEPHVHNHPEPHYAPHYSPTYAPHYEPHTTVEHDLTSVKDNNNGPTAGKISFSRRGFPGAPGPHFEGHPKPHTGPHFEDHPEPHYEPHSESHYEPHPEPHYVNHPEPHVHNHPEPHYEPHYSPSYKPHYEPHTTLEHEVTALENNNNGPTAGKISFSRRGFPGAPGPHFEDHPEPHYEPHSESHYEPHPEPHYVNHPEPHVHNHPEPHYEPHYSPTYAPHYEPHNELDEDLTSLKNNNNGPTAGKISFSRRGFPGAPGPHFEGHPKPHSGPHFEDHPEPHYEPHAESHYEPHPEPHFEDHPEPHFENHPEPHYEPHYSPSYAPHYEPHTTLDDDLTSLKNNKNGPSAGSISFSRRAYAPAPEADAAGSSEDRVEAPQCAAQVHEVVRTVTRTQYKTAEATHVAYQSAPVVEASAMPVHAPQNSAGADPLMNPYRGSAPAVATSAAFSPSPQHSAGADPMANSYAASAPAPHNHASHRPMSQAAEYSMIPVHVPMATPVSHGAMSQATSSNSMGKMVPSGVSAEQKGSPSSSASASVSHGIMFQGDAARLSGGIISAAAAVMGVLAFIL
ncbi:hypothetical protein N7517_002829 [Penicillium concentricum]|uniref:Uncharacterized protein n=1 Tax=Penicillium concentricum TaxID=293559 RepID=A0A9W9SUI2_9EURO|nr:uncharacterized protein N7517_002829 [Penicillium concentricum]KAJ5384918.1 hypothetical protein N7517_002829 [Penicillium concentricum]